MQSGQEWSVFVSFVHGSFRIIKRVHSNFSRMVLFLQSGKGLRWHANLTAPDWSVLEAPGDAFGILKLNLSMNYHDLPFGEA